MVSLTSLSEEERRRLLQQQIASGMPTEITPASVQGSLLGTPDLPGIFPTPSPAVSPTLGAIPSAVEPSVTPALQPEIPTIPSATGGLSGAAQGRLQGVLNKWGGFMDAHAFATGATSRRKSFESGLGNIFAAPKADQFKEIVSGNWKYTYHKNPQTGEWTVIAAAPRWEPKSWSTTKDINGRPIFAEGPHMGRLLSDVSGLPQTAKEYKPETKIVMFEYGQELYSKMVQARQYGLGDPRYIEAKRLYDDFTDQPGTEANVQRFAQINKLEAETAQAANDYGDGSAQHIAAQENQKQFSDLIAASEKGYQPKVTEFMRTSEDGTVEKFPGYIQYAPDNGGVKPIFKDMEGNVLTDVVQAPTTATTPAFLQKWQMHERLKRAAGWKPNDAQLSAEFEKFMMNEQVVTQQGYGLADIRKINDQIIATKTATVTVGRILQQLANKNVLTGVVGSIFMGWEGVKDQAQQLAITTTGTAWRRKGDNKYAIRVDERSLLNQTIYQWNRGDVSAGLRPNVVYLAYSLARALDPSGRLSDFDVQVQIENLTAGGNSKSKMAKALYEIHNRIIEKMRFHYEGARNIQNMQLTDPETGEIKGLPNTFEKFLEQQNMVGRLMQFKINATGNQAIGYQVPVYDENGEIIGFEYEPIAQWEPTP